MIFYAKVLVLALIQGAAELLPVSSSAHVILAQKLMGLDPSELDMVFLLIMLHTGTMFAAIVYFWSGWKALLFPKEVTPGAGRDFIIRVVIATALTGTLGLALLRVIERWIMERLLGYPHGEVEQLFRNLPLIGAALTAAGILILASSYFDKSGARRPLTSPIAALTGLVQGLCLPFRGFSRSGATISVGLLCGIPRKLAEEFSFALAVVLTPPLIVRQAWRLLSSPKAADTHFFELILPGLVGMVLAFLSGLAALRLLSAVLEGGRWAFFGFYCLIFAVVMFVAAACGF